MLVVVERLDQMELVGMELIMFQPLKLVMVEMEI